MPIVYLNGQYLPIEEATISPMDRGFLFADSVYEVIPVYNGKLFRFEQHLNRLNNSLNAIQLKLATSQDEWLAIFKELLQQNPSQSAEHYLYLQISRGAALIRDLLPPNEIKPTVFAFCNPYNPPSLATIEQGFAVITTEDARRRDCYIKATGLMPNILARIEAQQANAIEAILIRDGKVTEACSSNVFIVKNNVLKTPALSAQILGGITRDLIIELAQKNQIAVQETELSLQDLEEADEIWITSSMREIYPVTKLNGMTVSNGQAGPMWQRMIELYRHYKAHF